ncbi:MAG: two-component regulator propeller domain-containing protein [Draconibacterium sp.]
MKSRACILFLSLFLIAINLCGNDKKFQHFTTSDGLSYNTIYDITQDAQGFIWIATSEGLNRYDSYGFKTYYAGDTEGSLPGNDVRTLLVTQNGQLLIGTTHGLCVFNAEDDNFTPILHNGQRLNVFNLFQSRKGLIFISSSAGVFKTTSPADSLQRLSMEGSMFRIQEDLNGNYWCFRRQRLFQFDEDGNILKTIYVRLKGLPEFIPSSIASITIDSDNDLWIGTFKDGPFLLDVNTYKLRPLHLKQKHGKVHPMYFVRSIAEDNNGKFWVGTEKGLFVYDKKSGSYEHYMQSFDPTAESLNDNAIYRIYKSRENIMWIGTYFGGLNIFDPVGTGFNRILPGITPNRLQGKAISQIIRGPDKKLWIATEDGGIALYDENKHSFSHILDNATEDIVPITNNVHALTVDKNGIVWSGNFYRGVNKIDPVTHKMVNYSHVVDDPHSLTNNFVFSLYTDKNDLMWVGSMNGVDCFNKTTQQFTRFKPDSLRGKFIYDIFQDKEENYWFCTNNGTGLYRYNPKNDDLTHFGKDSLEGFQSHSFIGHCIDSEGRIWFASRGDGLVLFDPKTQHFTSYNKKDGLPSNVVYGILEDDKHNLWLSSNNGISMFNYKTGEIQNYNIDHGLVGNQFNYKSYFKAEDGTMYFGAVNGLSYFHPDDIKIHESKPVVHFTDFRLFNEIVEPGKNSVLKKHIDQTKELELAYNQNFISFNFIALDLHSRGKNNFYYYMDGFEPTWQPAENQRSATYTNLPPGEYYFRIKATNDYNYPNDLQRSIKLIINPPIWKTTWAYLLYAIVLSVIVFLFYRFNAIRQREKMTLKIEKIEKAKLRELHQHKINFFTYISHEFKTPLTIILASMDTFFRGENVPPEFKTRMITLKRNVQRLQFLINQLMDFRKIETDHAKTNLQSGDVIQFLREVFNTFNALFGRKELEYIFISERDVLFTRFDPDKLEKIVSNLLSNAFKFTPQNGEITLKINVLQKDGQSYLQLNISDTGDGLSQEKLDKIFHLFYKDEENQNEYQGSGIGLTLTKSLVKFLNGTIDVKSVQNEGTTFTVTLPVEEEIEKTDDAGNIELKKSVVENLLIQSQAEEHKIKPNEALKEFEILFAEDNQELLKFLADQFNDRYTIRTVTNGLEALASVKKNIPDLIVTDLMMPQMDGMALCKELKSNFEYCHVPIIMLTAKSDVDTRLETLEVGADYYLAKPFLFSELELQVRNILSAKANLKKHFIRFGNMDVEHPIKNRDQQFIEKVSALIHQNLMNPDFGVNILTKELGIGRTLLHTKLKQILDMSATEFINTLRLNEAKVLLKQHPEMTMSEIAYRVGFNDPNYFSRTFRKIFNVSPSSYRAGEENTHSKLNETESLQDLPRG